MTETFERLKAALADRYAIEREIGSGGMATVYLSSGPEAYATCIRRHSKRSQYDGDTAIGLVRGTCP